MNQMSAKAAVGQSDERQPWQIWNSGHHYATFGATDTNTGAGQPLQKTAPKMAKQVGWILFRPE